MILNVIRFIRQMVEWRRTKRCMAHLHKWEKVKHPRHDNVIIMRCKYCHIGFDTIVGEK